MNGENKIDNYIELLSKTDFGILSVDIGRLKNEYGEWHQETGFCAEIAKGIHEEVSSLYKDIVGQEPVNYLFEHFNSGLETINKDYYVYAFKVNSNLFEIDKYYTSLDNPEKELSFDLVKDIRGDGIENYDPLGDQSAREDIKKKFFDGLKTELTLEVNAKEKFKASQKAFTNAVGYAYYKKGLPLNFVTIVLLTYKRDNCSIFSNSIVLFSSKPLTIVDASIDEIDEGTIGDPILQLIFENIRGDKYLDRIEELGKKIKNEAQKSAKAAIMSRNMSHNLGSHVMAYLKHHLSSVKDMLNDNILSQLFENEEELKSLIEDPSSFTPKLLAKLTSGTNNENTENEEKSENAEETTSNELKTLTEEDIISNVALPFLVGLGQFISYLQERQDFIATIATDYIPYYSTINFKDFIYDELNNDKRYERHPDRQNLKPDNILLGNIARSEGLGRITSPTCSSDDKASLHDIVLKFRTTFNGDPVERIEKPFVDPLKYYKTKEVWLKAKNELDEMRNYEVSLPGGIVGRQAVFSIIENIIRNAAKHGNWREKGTLEITLDIFSKEDVLNDTPSDLLKERLPNNDGFGKHSLSLKQVLRKYYCHDDEKNNDLYFVTVTDNLSISQLGADEEKGISPDSLSSLRKALIEDYIDENSQMRNSNKGIKEMRISASWLRSIDDNPRYYLYDENNYKVEDGLWAESQAHVPPVIYARISKDSVGDCHLQYIFCLVRPQKVAFISDFVNIGQKAEMSLRASSWRVFTPESFIRYGNKSFDIIVFDGAKQSHSYNEIRRKSSSRFICLTEKGISTSITNTMSEIKNAIMSNWDVDRDSIKNAEILLYGQLAKWDKKEKILITDTKAESHFKQDTNKDEGVEDKITFYSSDANAKYRYITHLEDRVKFREHIINDLDFANQFSFSEGITGNNSTDRLVRNEKITEKWFFKHLHAMKQKVAIFDERIFSKSFGLEEADLSLDIFDDPKYSALKKCSDKVKNKFLEKGDLTPYLDLNSVNTKNYLGATYLFKGVFVFSIIRSSEKTDIFNLYGCQLKTDNSNTFSECIKYATLSWDKDNMMLNIIPCDGINSEIIKDFNSISIHQGLLDKLYGIFGIKGDNQARENLTKDFYSFFVGEENIIEFTEDKNEECKHYFLPGMTIHSGRSKPSESDMPQRLPFVPFSAIEHAVLDCKYSLVELLDSARYE